MARSPTKRLEALEVAVRPVALLPVAVMHRRGECYDLDGNPISLEDYERLKATRDVILLDYYQAPPRPAE